MFAAGPRQPLHALVGPDRRRLSRPLLLRNRSVAGAALSVGPLRHREPPGLAVQRPAQDPHAALHPAGGGDGLRFTTSGLGRRCFSTNPSWPAWRRRRRGPSSPRSTPSTGPPSPKNVRPWMASWRRSARPQPDSQAVAGRPRSSARPRRRGHDDVRARTRALIARAVPRPEVKDADYIFLDLRDDEPSAGTGRAPAGGDSVRRHVFHGQRAHRARRLYGGRLLQAQHPARCTGRALLTRRAR